MEMAFDAIRPYRNDEIPAAMQRIAAHPYFKGIAHFIFPSLTEAQARIQLQQVRTIHDFQYQWMAPFNKRVIETTIRHFTFDSEIPLDPSAGYLFISNHRDIVMDSSLLQMVLLELGLSTSDITYGNNLIYNELVLDIARSNKMVKVIRDGGIRDLLGQSMTLSSYILQGIDAGRSCWIAQRNGRTKDGKDATNHGLIKMLGMAAPKENSAQLYDRLHIVPVSISYEVEPCDFQKAREIYVQQHLSDGKYQKKPQEDMESVLTGILQWKGNVHFHIGAPLTKDDFTSFPVDRNGFCDGMVHLLDSRIISHYKLFGTHYAACDLLSGEATYAQMYRNEDVVFLQQRAEDLIQKFPECEATQLRELFIAQYANPVLMAASVA